jgi:hypothetical protein
MIDEITAYIVPGIVAVLTAVGATIGVQFRDVDTYRRRRGFWQWLLVLLAALATAGATNSASGFGRPLAATLMAALAAGAVILAHFMWRRLVPEAEHRNQLLATGAAALAVIVVVGAVAVTYIAGKGCRQAEPLVKSSLAQANLILPSFDGAQGPTVGDYEAWAKQTRQQAQQVTDGDVAPRANKLAELAEQIADTARTNDKGQHAISGAQYYDELKGLLMACPLPQ